MQNQAQAQGGMGGLLCLLTTGVSSWSSITSAIEGGLVGSLGNKFGLSSAITGVISAALPVILQKFAPKVNDPNNNSITPESIQSSWAV